MTIDRDKTTLWRGLAISGIVIHNLLVGNFGFVGCNEMTFRISKTEDFMSSILHPSLSSTGDIFAFLGWIGVPVFVFLSGYGLQKKYGKTASVNSKEYFTYNYRKLLLLLLPAVLFYSAFYVLTKNWPSLFSSVLSLSLLGNLWHLQLPLNPSIYWYFGLTWELYILYLIFRKCFTSQKSLNSGMLVLSGGGIFLMILAFYLFPENSHPLEWLRRNFIGWIPLFCLGLWTANTQKSFNYPKKTLSQIIASLLMFTAICLANLNFFSWLFVPFMALAFIVLVNEVIYKIGWLRTAFVWIGGNSSYIFVVHPIARGITHGVFENHFMSMVVSYIPLTILLAVLFKMAKEKLLKAK